MPGATAATKSRRCGRIPMEPLRVSATIRVTALISAKIREGRRILSCMRNRGLRRLPFSGCRLFRLVDRPNHVEAGFRIILELVLQNTFAAVERILQSHRLSLDPAELFGSEKGLGEKPFQAAGPSNYLSVFRGKLFKPQHGDDILELLVLAQGPTDLLR